MKRSGVQLRFETRQTADLALFEGNPRRGSVETIAESLAKHGQYKPIVVNEGTLTGRPLEVLAGNHTLLAARSLEWDEIDVVMVDLPDAAARAIVAADNRTADLGEYDEFELLELLRSLDDLEGTGYDQDYLDMLDELTSGPPGLDDLEDEHGPPKDDDAHDVIRLRVDPEINSRWIVHRKGFESDDAALKDLLDRVAGLVVE